MDPRVELKDAAGAIADPAAAERAILARTELFRGLPDAVLGPLQAAAFRRRLAAEETAFLQGDEAENVYVVEAGRLRATQTTAAGQQIIIRYLGPGEVAGYTALSGGGRHPGTVAAVDDSRLIGWSGMAVRALMAEHPQIAINAVGLLATRYHELQVRLRELATEKVERRLAHAILRLADQAGRRTARGVEIAFPLSRQDLAEMTGTTLHTVSRTLSAWETQGLVDCGRRRVIVAKPTALAALAERDDEF